MVLLETPGVKADRNIVGKRIGAGEIEINDAREFVAEKEYVVGKQVGVNDSVRQVLRPQLFAMREFGGNRSRQIAMHIVGARRGLLVEAAPARDRERILPLHRKIGAGKMQFCKRAAD